MANAMFLGEKIVMKEHYPLIVLFPSGWVCAFELSSRFRWNRFCKIPYWYEQYFFSPWFTSGRMQFKRSLYKVTFLIKVSKQNFISLTRKVLLCKQNSLSSFLLSYWPAALWKQSKKMNRSHLWADSFIICDYISWSECKISYETSCLTLFQFFKSIEDETKKYFFISYRGWIFLCTMTVVSSIF